MQIVFLVLHYKTFEITKRCIDSILQYPNCEIIVMDNGSNNSSGEMLERFYEDYSNVHVVISSESWGFSKGNNYALLKVKEMGISPDFLIACNNDLIFEQNDFLEKLSSIYEKTKAAVIGPDIRMYKDREIHQNPLMLRARTADEIREYQADIDRKITNINLILAKQRLKKFLGAVKKHKNTQVNLPNFDYLHTHEGVCLCGACLIFTPTFFSKYENLFEPETYFYHEEEILFYRLNNNGDFMLYTPDLCVFHDHSISTSTKFESEKERLEFQYKNNLNSCDVLLKYIEK